MKKTNATYIDAYVLVIKKKDLAKYKKAAKQGAESWLKHGALTYRECIGEDLNPYMYGFPVRTFPKLLALKKDELPVFSYIEYKSKAHRNQVNKKVAKEMEAYAKDHPDHMKDIPFDHNKLSFGGFKIIVGA